MIKSIYFSREKYNTRRFSVFSLLKAILVTASISMLLACSGSGGGGSNEEPTPKPAPKPAPKPDTKAPSIVKLEPVAGSTIGNAANKRPIISVTFSEKVTNVDNTNVVFKQGANKVEVVITGSGTTYGIKPNADLIPDANYTLEFKAGIKDVAGNALVAVSKNYKAGDFIAPTLVSLSPVAGTAIGSPSDKRPVITVNFSENVQNVNTANVVLKQGTNPVALTITGSGKAYSIKPNADLIPNANYVLEFKAGIKDTAGNAFVAVSKSYPSADFVIISSMTPAHNAKDISVATKVSLTFSKAVTGVNTANVLLSKNNDGSSPVTLTSSGSGANYIFTPSAKLEYNTEYFIVIKAANIKDSANKPLGSANQVKSFTTYKQKVNFSAWLGGSDSKIDISSGSLPSNSELYTYTGASYSACDIANITACSNGQALSLNGQTITNTTHTLTQPAFYKLKEGNLISTDSSENTARFSARFEHQSVFFKNKFWVIGGRDSSRGSRKDDVWSSSDGVNWTRSAHIAPRFFDRGSHQVVVANIDGEEKLWLIGGHDGTHRKNDVWSSSNGVNWTLVKAHKANPTPADKQFSARAEHQVVAFNNKLWVIGGYDGNNKNDVWYSSNGKDWTKTANVQFAARYAHQVVVFDGKLWVIGGSAFTTRLNDVWSSSDGTNWTLVKRHKVNPTPADKQFSARAYHKAVAFDNKLWVIGGVDGNNKNDVWSSTDGVSWSKSTINNSSHFSARQDSQVVVGNAGGSDKLYLIGGMQSSSIRYQDVWRSADGATWRKGYFGEITRP